MTTDVEIHHDEWSTDDLVSHLRKDYILSDSAVLRVLAARIAARASEHGHEAMLAEDLYRAFGSLAIAVRHMVEMVVDDDSHELWKMVGTVDRAAAEMADLTGCF